MEVRDGVVIEQAAQCGRDGPRDWRLLVGKVNAVSGTPWVETQGRGKGGDFCPSVASLDLTRLSGFVQPGYNQPGDRYVIEKRSRTYLRVRGQPVALELLG